ncbi:MAG: 3-isopropylmalate dehydratase small subunit [Cyanobacteriota bacterium]|nr:3-isopropylmalate dehydratase small subunit [Cyanobacteriota bacterium]
MSQIQQIAGRGIPLRGNDIDTDRIIPARFLRCVTFDGLGEQAFADDRAQAGGNHPFDLSQYQGATILAVNGNFGCGSSREHAPQALAKWGIKAIIGESFAEIFFGNCLAIGLPCVTADPAMVRQLQTALEADPQAPVNVDLNAMQARYGDLVADIRLDNGPRQMLTGGTWDSCGQLVARSSEVRATAGKLPYLSWQTAAN